MSTILTQEAFESGGLDNSGLYDNQTQLRTKNFIPYFGPYDIGFNNIIKTRSGKTVYIAYSVYNVPVEPRTNGYDWYQTPIILYISDRNVRYVKIALRYADETSIDPSDIISVELGFLSVYPWMWINGEPCIRENPKKQASEERSFPSNANWAFKRRKTEDNFANGFVPESHDIAFPKQTAAKWVWRASPDFNNGNPHNGFMFFSEPKGAFRNAERLERVYIPETVKKIGAEAFRYTALKTVRIAADCEYSPTSFPEGCEVEFYGGGGDFGQLYDCDGYAVLDCEAARIYVRSENMADTDEKIRLEVSAKEVSEVVLKMEQILVKIAELEERISALESK